MFSYVYAYARAAIESVEQSTSAHAKESQRTRPTRARVRGVIAAPQSGEAKVVRRVKGTGKRGGKHTVQRSGTESNGEEAADPAYGGAATVCCAAAK